MVGLKSVVPAIAIDQLEFDSTTPDVGTYWLDAGMYIANKEGHAGRTGVCEMRRPTAGNLDVGLVNACRGAAIRVALQEIGIEASQTAF